MATKARKIVLSRTTNKRTLGTSLQGMVHVSHGMLVRRFGKPVNPRDPKVDAEWRLSSPTGVIVTIYRRADVEGKSIPLKATDIWRVGGKSAKAVHTLREALPRQDFMVGDATYRGRGRLLLASGKLRKQKRGSIVR